MRNADKWFTVLLAISLFFISCGGDDDDDDDDNDNDDTCDDDNDVDTGDDDDDDDNDDDVGPRHYLTEFISFSFEDQVLTRIDPARFEETILAEFPNQDLFFSSLTALTKDRFLAFDGERKRFFFLNISDPENPFSLIRPDTDHNFSGLALCGDGTLYGLEVDTNQLWTVDPDTMEQTLVGPTGQQIAHVGMSCHPQTGELYALNGFTGSLYVLDKETGQATTVGVFEVSVDHAGLEFDPISDVLYATLNESFYMLNPRTGEVIHLFDLEYGMRPNLGARIVEREDE